MTRYFDYFDLFACILWIFKDQTSELEKNFAKYIGVKYAIASSYGRTALYLGLKAINVKDKEVIIPSFICTVVRQAVTLAGGIPIFVDINYKNFCLNIYDLESKITNRTKAILLTHYFGKVAVNTDEILRIAKKNNLILIEDCAHVLGAEYNGKKLGTYGDFAIFSFTKNTINFGGGILTTNNPNIFSGAKEIIDSERISTKKRIADFPIIFAYGIEQMITRLILDRFKFFKLKIIAISIPFIILKFRARILGLFNLTKVTRLQYTKNSKEKVNVAVPSENTDIQPQYLKMEPIISSLALSQLKKIDILNKKRCKVYQRLVNNDFSRIIIDNGQKDNFGNVYTNFLNECNKKELQKVLKYCHRRGLFLRSTWPTHQKVWENQDTKILNKIKNQILTGNIHPDLNNKEINKTKEILSLSKNQ